MSLQLPQMECSLKASFTYLHDSRELCSPILYFAMFLKLIVDKIPVSLTPIYMKKGCVV